MTEVELPYRAPLAFTEMVTFLADRAAPGIEDVTAGVYRRTLTLDRGLGIVALGPASGTAVACRLQLEHAEDLDGAVARCRRLLDLDADPDTVDGALATDPLLAPLVAGTPGRRSPGHVDGTELAMRAVLGQQVSVKAARRLAAALAELCGRPLPEPVDGLTVAFPSAAAIAEADLDRVGMPASRRATVRVLAAGLAAGDIRLDPGADPEEAEEALLRLPGIGPWTAAYIRMRALGDPDVFLPTDLGVRHALAGLGLPGRDDGAAAGTIASRWQPWRSYAVHHLWASLPANGSPATRRAAGGDR